MSWGIYAAAGVVLLVLLRCALVQKRGVRCFLAGGVCGLAVLALLQPVTGLDLPLNRFTAFAAAALGVPGVAAVLVLRVILRV